MDKGTLANEASAPGKWHLGVGGSLSVGGSLGFGGGLGLAPAHRLLSLGVGGGLDPAPMLLNGDELVTRKHPGALAELGHNLALLSRRKPYDRAHLARRDVAV